MSNSIKCVCADDSDRPKEIPESKWPKKGNEYHVTHIFLMKNQGNIKGCELAEFDISMCHPYNCYRLSRFAFTEEDFLKLLAMIKRCDKLNEFSDLDIQRLVDDVPIREKEAV